MPLAPVAPRALNEARLKRNPWLALSALLGAVGVILGALGSHLFDVVRTDQYDLANRYHLLHVVLLAALSLTLKPTDGILRHVVMAGFALGLVLFCGALYLSSLGLAEPRLAPAGGSILILSWIALAVYALLPSR